MNRNNIRPAVIGVAAGATVFGALVAWVEFDPWRSISEVRARRQLTTEELAALNRIAADRQARDDEYRAQRAESAQRRAETADLAAEGFRPDLLATPRAITSVQELATADLVAEIVHIEQVVRQNYSAPWAAHRDALLGEWQRRDTFECRYTGPRVEQMRHQIYHDQVEIARFAPYPVREPLAPMPWDGITYPEFAGPNAAHVGDDDGTGMPA
jgi:hypothetical protein